MQIALPSFWDIGNIVKKNELSALYKLVNKNIVKDYEKYRQNVIEKHLYHTGSTKKAYRELRTNKTWIEGLKNLDKDTNKRTDIITTATDFYKKLYSDKTRKSNSNIHVTFENIAAVGEVEIIEAIKRLKLEKSPGPDNITNEALKTAHTILATPLAELFNLILQKSETPTQWSESNIILLYKKGDPKDIGNYRPISLLPTLYKLFSTIINARISPTIGARQPVEQAGFRKAFSTIDHIHTLELIIEKYQEHQRPLYLAFIDYQKAFDTLRFQWAGHIAERMDVGVPRCWNGSPALVSAALVDPQRGRQTTSSASHGATGHKRHKTVEFRTPIKIPKSSSGRLSVDMVKLKPVPSPGL
ncbi:jg21145 [Pararge aegeria aegeria]|uniref:Jg21145 protein n=1 Tax=Pararge aegeria aegeria TaxID=348720 RepID=A0A8S4SPM3_9NEOP|nr:jg21145 [Pararge aegeria aegeria]